MQRYTLQVTYATSRNKQMAARHETTVNVEVQSVLHLTQAALKEVRKSEPEATDLWIKDYKEVEGGTDL